MSASSSAVDEAGLRRLAASLEKIASCSLDECPVCLDAPAPSDARILRCCAAIMCRHCIPACNRTCPFCRAPFQEGQDEPPDEGESPYTYTVLEYAAHAEYVASVDYTVSRRYESNDYSALRSYSSREYTPSSDFSSMANKYTATNDYSGAGQSYTANRSYTSQNYTAGSDYSGASSYSVPDDKYKATATDFSDIASKYSSS